MKNYVLYHKSSPNQHCLDGLGARYAAWRWFKDDATYIPVCYGQPVPEMEPQSNVYILDFSYPREVIEQLRSDHSSLVVLDHHKTAEKALEGLSCCHFDMKKSGAVLAWEYFHPNTEVPKLLQHVQDRDLWKFELFGTKEINEALVLLGDEMHLWHDIVANTSGIYGISSLMSEGHILLKRDAITINNKVKETVVIPFLGKEVGFVNTSHLVSEVGNAICEQLPVDFACCYFIVNQHEVSVSFRSIGDVDISAVAKLWGGGGHKNAAGCKWSLQTLQEILAGEYANE